MGGWTDGWLDALSTACLSRGHEMTEEQILSPSPPLLASVCPPVPVQLDERQHAPPQPSYSKEMPSQLKGAGVYGVQFSQEDPVSLSSPPNWGLCLTKLTGSAAREQWGALSGCSQ